MALIQLDHLYLQYPVYGADRSLKRNLVNFATGGRLEKNNSKVYVEALRDIHLELKEGDRLGLVGHNGAGKTTLLKTLAQIYTPTSGKIMVDGRVGCLFDITMGMESESTGYENIILGSAILFNLSRSKAKTRVIPDVEEFAELGDFMNMPVRMYSAGMILRLAFGIMTSQPSDILLLDEVVSVGDARFMERAKGRLANLVHKAKIMVLSTHDLSAIREMCNKVLWLEHGEVKMLGNVETVLSAYEVVAKSTI